MTDKFVSNADLLPRDLNLEIGKLGWDELERHFARGVVVIVSDQLELIEVATRFAEDKKDEVENWMHANQITRANDEHAKIWNNSNPVFRAIVVAPWVLVQEVAIP